MQTITGSFAPIQVSGVVLDEDRQGRYIEIPTSDALYLMENIALREADFTMNNLGLFSRIRVGRDNKARFARLSAPKHVIQARKNGCSWNPKGRILMGVEEHATCPVEINMEECPDAFYGDCLERIFGTGNGVRDFMGTTEGAQLMQMMLNQLYLGIGNSTSELYHFALHPLIQSAHDDGTYTTESEKEWSDYYDQMMNIDCPGLITLLDTLALDGVPGYNMQIPDSDIDAATDAYTGDIEGLFEKLIATAKPAFKQWILNGANVSGLGAAQSGLYVPVGGRIFPLILVTTPEFKAYEDAIIAKFGTIPEVYQYYLTRQSGDRLLMPNVLRYKGCPVVPWDEVTTFDTIVGTTSHRVAIVAPGNFGVAHDVNDLALTRGTGLRMTQRIEAPYQGKIYFDTTYRIGAALLDMDFCVMASNIQY